MDYHYYDTNSKLQDAAQMLKVTFPQAYCAAENESLIWCSFITPELILPFINSKPYNEEKLEFRPRIVLMIFDPQQKPRIWIGYPDLFNQIKHEHPEFSDTNIYKYIANNRINYNADNQLEEVFDYYIFDHIQEDKKIDTPIIRFRKMLIKMAEPTYFHHLQPTELVEILFINRIINEIAI